MFDIAIGVSGIDSSMTDEQRMVAIALSLLIIGLSKPPCN